MKRAQMKLESVSVETFIAPRRSALRAFDRFLNAQIRADNKTRKSARSLKIK